MVLKFFNRNVMYYLTPAKTKIKSDLAIFVIISHSFNKRNVKNLKIIKNMLECRIICVTKTVLLALLTLWQMHQLPIFH